MEYLRVFYFVSTGEIWNCLYNIEILSKSIEVSCNYIDIDIIPENMPLCEQMRRKCTLKDENGLQKWYISNNELYEREGWIEYGQD